MLINQDRCTIIEILIKNWDRKLNINYYLKNSHPYKKNYNHEALK